MQKSHNRVDVAGKVKNLPLSAELHLDLPSWQQSCHENLPGASLQSAANRSIEEVDVSLERVYLKENLDAGMARVECNVANTMGFALTAKTSVSFLHLFLERAACMGVLTQAQTRDVGASATKTVCRWVKAGLLSEYKPSQLAAVALDCAVPVHDSTTAGKVAEVVDRALESPRVCRLYRKEFLYGATSTVNSVVDDICTGVWCGGEELRGRQQGGKSKGKRVDVEGAVDEYDTDELTPPSTTEEAGGTWKGFFTEEQVNSPFHFAVWFFALFFEFL